MNQDLSYLFRTVQLAELGDGRVLDSPRVGSLLVHDHKIIGEGYHKQAGSAHAEVNCLAAVSPADRHLIPKSTLYVSLEPCCVVGKTGACSTLILNAGIKTVVIGQRDSTPGVSGGSVELLRRAGLTVREYPDFAPAVAPYLHRHVLVTRARPYVLLKFAQSADGYLRPGDRTAPYWITNPISRRLVHRWRARTNAIVIGARTLLDDDPLLTTRLWPGPNPLPIVVDPRSRASGQERIFRGKSAPLVYTPVDLSQSSLREMLEDLASRRLAHVTVEGGAALLSAFLEAGLWDEARVFTGSSRFGGGLPAPRMNGHLIRSLTLQQDRCDFYRPGGTPDVNPA